MSCKNDTKSILSDNFEIGIITDCQYCNCEDNSVRFYKNSTNKLRSAVNILNTHNLSYTIHLGDFIDRDFESFDSVLPIWSQLKSEKRHVLGNHDFNVADSLKPFVLGKLELKKRYYSFEKNNWRFIVLDGNDLSYYGAADQTKKTQTDSLFNRLEKENPPNLQMWNGGFSLEQLNWVKNELDEATKKNEKVGFYCHFPAVKEGEMHNLWNYKHFLKVIEPYGNVKFYFNGHNHAGDYIEKNGVHHLTFRGMVNTKDSTAFAIVAFTKDSIFVKGYGREISRRLKIK
jgi:hypothetical protein